MRLPKLLPSDLSHQPSFSNLGRVIFTFQLSTFNPENLSTMDSIIQQKSREFAIRIIGCYKYLIEEQRELVMSKQLLRCGTSIGANTRESKNAQSRMDFLNKLNIALKEADETEGYD
jgi:hypothetical protein